MDLLYALPCLLVSAFTSDFRFYDYYTIPVHILPFHLYFIPPVFCSYLIIPRVFPTWYHLLYIYLLLHAYAHDTVFNACLWFRFIDTHVLITARHLAFASPLAGEFWLLWVLMSRSWSLERVDSPSCWSEWRSWSVVPSRPSQAPSFQAPCSALEFLCYGFEPPLVSFILIYPLFLAFAPYWWCNIIVLLCHIWW